jgi:hypothetical protein
MKFVSFWKEFNERAGFVWVVAITNPIFVLSYVMFFHEAAGGMQFLMIGFLLTAAVCIIAGGFMALVILVERHSRSVDIKRKAKWHDVMPYDPREAARLKSEAS